MSIIDHILITIDDKSKSKQELEEIFYNIKPSVLYSSVGRLISKELIKEYGRGRTKRYVITSNGSNLIKNSLNSLREMVDGVNHVWLLISVSISEKYKVEREKIRLVLKDNGFGIVRNGLFIGRAQYENIHSVLKKFCKNANIYYFVIHDIPKEIIENPSAIWNINISKDFYHKWNKEVIIMLEKMPRNEETRRINSKMFVYELSCLVRKEAKIPDKNFADLIGRSESFKLYRKIRNYCYQ